MEKKCAVCGNVIEEGARICQFCGAAQEDAFGDWHGTSYGRNTADDLRWNDLGQKRAAKKAAKRAQIRKNRMITAAIVLGCVIALVAFVCLWAYFAQFKCGDNARWKLDDGTLTIKGEGEMYDRWQCEFRDRSDEIEKVVIEDGITSIGYMTFEGLEKLKSAEIADSVTNVDWNVFEGCSALTNVKLSENCTKISSDMFKGCSSLESIEIPDCVTSVDNYAFKGCSSLVSIEIPDSVTSVGSGAFEGCSSLTQVKLPENCTEIASDMFKDCSSLVSIEIPDCVTSVGSGAFEGCSSLESIEIPDSVTEIAANAFWGCAGLEKVIFKSFDVWENTEVSDSGNGTLDGHIYFADGTHLLEDMEQYNGSEYSISNGEMEFTGQWRNFDVINCVSFDLKYQIGEIESGNPYGAFDIYVLKSDDSYEKVASMNVTDTSVVETRVEFGKAMSIKGVAAISRADGEYSFTSGLVVSNLVVED